MVSVKDIEKLPEEKIVEAFEKTAGFCDECPDCGEFTAFIGERGVNWSSECHNCGYKI